MEILDWIRQINQALGESGLFVRGAFHPDPDDGAPVLNDGKPCGTVALIGNAGNTMWDAFQASGSDMSARHPLDTWVRQHLHAAAENSGAELLNPMRPPYPPIQQWAIRAGAGFRSPINLLVHPVYGLWHTFRAALLFADRRPLPPKPDAISPCTTCSEKPCLTRCPAGAFQIVDYQETAQFHPARCVDHVEKTAGKACQTGGCLARRVCPVGRTWAYRREPAAYHMTAVVRTVRRWQAGQDTDKPENLTVL